MYRHLTFLLIIILTGCNMRTPGREYLPEIYFDTRYGFIRSYESDIRK